MSQTHRGDSLPQVHFVGSSSPSVPSKQFFQVHSGEFFDSDTAWRVSYLLRVQGKGTLFLECIPNTSFKYIVESSLPRVHSEQVFYLA